MSMAVWIVAQCAAQGNAGSTPAASAIFGFTPSGDAVGINRRCHTQSKRPTSPLAQFYRVPKSCGGHLTWRIGYVFGRQLW